jgi:hypothetical protein
MSWKNFVFVRNLYTPKDKSWVMDEIDYSEGSGPPEKCVGLRWTGNPGFPASGSRPQWFILPSPLAVLARAFAELSKVIDQR